MYTSDLTNDANLERFVNLLTNGTEETIGTSGGLWTDDFQIFNAAAYYCWRQSDAGFAGNPQSLNGIDLWGYEIDEVQLRLNDLTLEHDGVANSFSFDVTVSILGNRRLLTGDADGNGSVDFTDFLIFGNNFDSPGRWINGDFDLNGQVDFTDFLALSTNFGKTGPAVANITPIPEPATVTILFGLALTALTMAVVRRSEKRYGILTCAAMGF